MYHSQSEEYAAQAEAALKNGERDRATELYRLAAAKETSALSVIDPRKTRTLGVTVVSATSLWFKAGDFRVVEQIACNWLATDHLPEFAISQLQTILQTTWNEQIFRQSGIEFVKGEILVSVSGGQIVTGAAPLELVHRKVNEVRNMFYRTIELLLNRPFRKRDLPSADIQEQFRPWLLQAPPGSYQFAVRVQKPSQMSLFPDASPQVEEITQKFLQIIEASAQETHEDLEIIVPDPEYRQGFLRLARNLAPTGKVYDRLEIKSATELEARPIVFVPDSRREINKTLQGERKTPEDSTELRFERLAGVLRGLHLDKDWIELSPDDSSQSIRIFQTGDVIDDVVGPMVNHRVVVDVALRPDGTRLYRDIQSED